MLNTPARPWEWTPSAFSNAMIATLLRTPVLHRLLSRRLLLLTFTGRKSGKHYTTPLGYYREGHMVTILTKQFRTWWRNFQDAAPVEVLMEGKTYQGEGQALTNEAVIIPIVTDILATYPSDASFWGVQFVPSGKPDMDDIRRIAPKVVAFRITLTE